MREIIKYTIKIIIDMKYLGQIFDNQWNTKNIINTFNYNLIAKLIGATFHNISQITKVNLFKPISKSNSLKFSQWFQYQEINIGMEFSKMLGEASKLIWLSY